MQNTTKMANSCRECDFSRLPNRATCNRHRTRNPPIRYHKGDPRPASKTRDKIREQRWNLKVKVFTHYCNGTPNCARCGIDDIRVLTLDHVKGNGAQSRREKSKGQGGQQYYTALIKLNYPDGYQILCANCHRIVEVERFDARIGR